MIAIRIELNLEEQGVKALCRKRVSRGIASIKLAGTVELNVIRRCRDTKSQI